MMLRVKYIGTTEIYGPLAVTILLRPGTGFCFPGSEEEQAGSVHPDHQQGAVLMLVAD